ncbi:MAG: carbohydrate binding domain-containing protein [Oscillospiraceae bacterium]|nr:carbohydrate binding domain-containing protein [Oscillospiraceae bacterium]
MKLTIHTEQETAQLGDLYGLFFEDINHAADGGLYAELVQNRSFEFCAVDNKDYHGLTAWEKVGNIGSVELTILEGDAISEKNPHYLELNVIGPGNVGVCNLGFNSGIPLRKGAGYNFSCYARRKEGESSQITVSLRSADGRVYQELAFHLSDHWEKYVGAFTAPVDDWSGRLAITTSGKGKIHLDFVSLFPQDTYKGRRNGLRRDIAEALEAMRPKFLRFPGGCLIHDGALDPDARNSQYRWKNSIGPVEHRPARRNNWGYNQTLGLGYYEYFLLCEDIRAKPLPVLPGGYNPHDGQAAEGEQLQAFIQDALDLIEFANGGLNTVWGAKRAELGHPEPFGLEYIGIGNEEVGEAFYERYPLFYQAIKAKYPDIKVIGTSGPFCAGPEYDRGWRSAREDGAQLVDEHYYQSPEWFVANHHHYDNFSDGPKVFLGEYASKDNTWFNALAEASYMVGLERNARVVGMACYAPLLCNEEYCNWRPNMLWFNNHQLMCTPSYYVQKLFMEHQGNVLLAQDLTGAGEAVKQYPFSDFLAGGFALSGHESTVEFSDIVSTNLDTGERMEHPEAVMCMGNGERLVMQTGWCNYSVSLKAREIDGWKGFYIWFARRGEGNKLCWQLGGWNNSDSLVSEYINGRDSVLAQKERHVEKNRIYHLELQVRGRTITTYVDGEKELEAEVLPTMAEPLYAVSGRDQESGDVIVKLVNILSQSQTVTIELDGMTRAAGIAHIMSGYNKDARNVLGKPETVFPREKPISFDTDIFQWTVEPESVCILRLHEANRKTKG